MRTLIIYYSRTQTTKKIAEKIAEKLSADILEIKDKKNRTGIKGYMTAGSDAMRGALTELEEFDKSPADYDLCVLATPVWAWRPSVPISTFIEKQKENMGEVALIITQGAEPPKQENIFGMMEEKLGKKSMANLHLSTLQVKKEAYEEQIKEFIQKIHS
ncbi:hypothetical protein C0583_03040 [Candidatus Parcubacteria bacterium]|nr:MAG: hypothetical protein C0583_03040 [Candidatus Parcubacteria bacterium]